ncbi:MAG: energy transducer TonB [Rikenellaceae bacterium]|nr:energy transducer TonB [Rikenellaceae bacterium]
MKKVRIASVLIALLVATTSMAQTVKTYKGPIKRPNSMIASLQIGETFQDVTYQYYEDSDGARIWHGSFSIPKAPANWIRGSLHNIKIAGQYNHGKQNGLWTETWVDNDGVVSTNKYNFVNGKLNGSYSFRSPNLFLALNYIAASFEDNKFVGDFLATSDDGFSMKGYFNANGLANGEWVIKYLTTGGIQHIRKYTYEDGIAMRIIDIDNSTGEKTVLREAAVSKYGTIVINNSHYRAVRTDELKDNTNNVSINSLIRNNDFEIRPLIGGGIRTYDGLFEILIDKAPIYKWVGELSYQPFMALKNCDYEISNLLAEEERVKAEEKKKEEEVKLREEMLKDDYVFETVDVAPKFQGADESAFIKWLYPNIKYPQYALDNEIYGVVIVSFIIEQDGTLTNAKIERSPDESLSEEALRVVRLSPKWEPGMQEGRKVRTKLMIPIRFVC